MRALLFTLFALPFVALPLAACGGNGGGGAGGSGDGTYHPAGNGQHQAQDPACAALDDAISARALALSCATTVPTCPSLIQAMVGGTECLEYDEGSVQGCVDYYNQQASCDALATAIDACVVTSFAGTEPKGCP